MIENVLANSPLGKTSEYEHTYAPHLLFAIPRAGNRAGLNIVNGPLPFQGVDIWNAYEISFLNPKGKPIVVIGEFLVPCTSCYLFESKSLKLYLNAFYQTKFESIETAQETIQADLTKVIGETVLVKLTPLSASPVLTMRHLEGEPLDEQDIDCDTYALSPHFLSVGEAEVTETLQSDLLKSNCLVTGQPDWASVQITYTGKKIDREGLLKYIVSFRTHNGFAEHCAEQIFMDLMQQCAPKKLTVYIRTTRRGGIDINPYRSTEAKTLENSRLWRQ